VQQVNALDLKEAEFDGAVWCVTDGIIDIHVLLWGLSQGGNMIGGVMARKYCGWTSLFQKHPLERFYRDMHLHMLQGWHDIPAQIVGASGLGEPYDVNRAH
jgi:hypothetical protein